VTKVLEILDLAGSGQVQLSWVDGPQRRQAPTVAFTNPLDEADRQELQWYFGEYQSNPFGPAKARADAAEQGLRTLGRLLFQTVIAASPESQALYSQAVSQGLEQRQLVIVSQRPQFLSVPWEALFDPAVGFLAPRLAGIVRQPVAGPLPPFAGHPSSEQFNVLLVSPMPSLPADSSTHVASLAPEVVRVLESLPVQVEMDLLQPPSPATLAQRLGQRRGYYHLVHLDGALLDKQGNLLLETSQGRPEPVPPAALAQALSQGGVPVLLATPGSAATTVDSWAAFNSALVQAGVAVAVGFPSALPAVAADKFLRTFYHSLASGVSAPAAVAAVRRALLEDPHRPTPAGKVVSWDWLLPCIFQSQDYSPPAIAVEKPSPTAAAAQAPAQSGGPQVQLPAAGPLGMVGRRGELRQLERLLTQNPVVRLVGGSGTGKTTLALELGRWMQKTGGRHGGVFYTTFDWGAGVERVVHEIGTAVAGLPFADRGEAARRRWVLEHLNEQPSLLIWDGVENIAGFPAGAPGLLDPAEQTDLANFLQEATQSGATRALLISRRREEPWRPQAGDAALELAGLQGQDRLDLGQKILERAEVDQAHLGPQYLEILELLDGHPLAMQIALSLLKQAPAPLLLSQLRAELAKESAGSEEGRPAALAAALECAWGHQSHRNRTHLPFLSLFQRRVMMDVLTHITQERPYRSVMREELGWGACRTLLRTALAGGFLEPVSPSVFQIHPAIPSFLGRKLRQQVAAAGVGQLEQEFLRVYADTADYFMESLYENQDAGATAVLAEEGNLTQALALALESRQWDQAQVLVQPLAQVYRMQKRFPELRRLRRQLLESTGQSAADAESRGAAELWLYLLGTEASEAADLMELDYAEDLNRQLLEYLSSRAQGHAAPRTAAVHHQLGAIALRRGQLSPAEDHLQKSLAIIEMGEDREAVADDYYSLGQVKQYQRRYTEAKEWFKKSLDIHQRLSNPEELVKDYRALGLMSQMKFEYQEAQSWYNRARDLVEENRDEETAVLVFHDLGTVAHAQYLFDEAESWYMQALSLSDRLGDEARMAVEMHHLGLLAQARGILYDDAEGWYLSALEKHQKLGNRRGEGDECRQLGVLFHEQKRLDEADDWYQKAREIFESTRDVQRTARTYGQLGMIAEERGDLPHALDWAARTYRLAVDYASQGIGPDLQLQVKAHLARLRDKYGVENFTQWWRGSAGTDPPADLDVDTSAIL